MKYYRLNQIAMAVLGALLLFFGARTIINIAYEEHKEPEHEVAEEEEGKPEEGSQLAELLASADAAHGEEIFKKCAICHSAEKGGPNMIGPDLYNVIGHKIASHEGFNYSPALKKHSADSWTYDNLDHWLTNPQAFAPGTTMAFPGLPEAKERADVIAFLRTKNDNPPPLPEVKAKEEKPAEKPAAEEAAAPGSEVLPLLATADPKQGEADAALCKVCHSFEKGGPAIVGPDIYGVVGRKIASAEGFNYSPALKKHADQSWTYENLDVWLTNPQVFAPGTTMAFPGVPDLQKRANIIAFLRVNADSPAPLPEAAAPSEEKPAAEEEAPAAEPEAPATEPEAPAAEPEAPAAEPEAPAAELETEAEDPEAAWTPPQGEPPSAGQPQPVYPEETGTAEEPEPSAEVEPSAGEGPFANQPQPDYPDGPPEGD
jgi:cytochrome c2